MWHRSLVVALAVVVAACSSLAVPDPPEPPDSSAAPTTSAAATTTTAIPDTTQPAPEVSTTTTPPDALAGLTPTGVVVPILAVGAGRFVVGTPCAERAVLTDLDPVGPVDVLIDPGHGGDVETGSVGRNGLREADLNLAVSRDLVVWLDERGVDALLTRTGDYRMAIRARAELARTVAPRLLVSVHHNAGSIGPADEPGTIVFHQVDDDASRRAAGLAYEELVAALEPLDLPWVNSFEPGAFAAVRDGDGRDAYGILRLTYPIPAILTEALFLQNPPEAEALATDEVQALEVEALGRAIVRFLDTDDVGSGFRDPEVYTFPVSSTGGTDGCVDPDLTG
ncbi:MAG: N-acetylmuramoyl-L-alanine amidase [Acidimicrobiia bacterium]